MARPFVWLAALVAAVALASTAQPAAADGAIVGPNQYFNGALAAHEVNSVIGYNCDNPHLAPVPIDAALSTQGAQAAGFTGSAATSIDVTLTLNGRTNSVELGTLTAYDTNFTASVYAFGPFCTISSGVITFTPEPSSPTAQPSIVHFWMITARTP